MRFAASRTSPSLASRERAKIRRALGQAVLAGCKGPHLAPISARLLVDQIKGERTVQGVDADAFLPQRFL